MRYKIGENIQLGGLLPANATVTIRVLSMATDTLLALSSNVCSESSVIPGLYMWSTGNIADSVTGYSTMYYEMTDGVNIVSGKFTFGGYVENVVPAGVVADAVWDKDLG